MSGGVIVAGVLAPHPPHLVYAENPPQNEPQAECGWETLRWGYERLRDQLAGIEHDVLVIMSPHWQTYIGTHLLGLERFNSLSVDPVFPNLFRYTYDLEVDVELSQMIHDAGADDGLSMRMMENADFRVDYGTITSCHLTNPAWDKPIVALSSNRSRHYYSVDVMQEMMGQLGEATRRAITKSGKRAVLLSSNSLSHRHFVSEGEIPEDMSNEHITNHSQHLWDMRIIEMLRKGQTRQFVDLMPEFTEQSMAETDAGALTWMLSALGFPDYPATLHGYGTVIGTGNAIVAWDTSDDGREIEGLKGGDAR